MRKAIRLFVLALLVVGGCSSDDAPEKAPAPAVAASNVIFRYVVLPGDESVIQLTDMHFATPGLRNRHEIQGNIRNLTNHDINAVASGYFDVDGTRLPFEAGYPLYPNRTAGVNIPNQSPQVQRAVIVFGVQGEEENHRYLEAGMPPAALYLCKGDISLEELSRRHMSGLVHDELFSARTVFFLYDGRTKKWDMYIWDKPLEKPLDIGYFDPERQMFRILNIIEPRSGMQINLHHAPPGGAVAQIKKTEGGTTSWNDFYNLSLEITNWVEVPEQTDSPVVPLGHADVTIGLCMGPEIWIGGHATNVPLFGVSMSEDK